MHAMFENGVRKAYPFPMVTSPMVEVKWSDTEPINPVGVSLRIAIVHCGPAAPFPKRPCTHDFSRGYHCFRCGVHFDDVVGGLR